MARRLIFVLLLTAYACNAATATLSPGPAASENPTAEPLPLFPERELPADASQWDRLIARVGARGTVDKQAALDAFSIAFTPLPGTSEPEGARAPVEDGTLAAMWIRHFWDELTAEQQSFADAVIRGDVPQALQSRRAQQFAAVRPLPIHEPAPLMATNDWQALANQMQATLEARLGRELDAQVVVKTLDTLTGVPPNLWTAPAWAEGRDSNGQQSGKLATCTIVISPQMVNADAVVARMTMAHEVFHCFHYAAGTIADFYGSPPWITEGAARFAELSLTAGGTDAIGLERWTWWLKNPEYPIYLRSYDAFGILYLLQDTGTEPWGVIDQILLAASGGSIPGYKKLVEIGGDFFLDTWGSRYFMLPAPDQGNFRYEGDGLTVSALFKDIEVLPITPGDQASERADPYAANLFLAYFNSDVAILRTPGGHGYVRTAAGESTLEGSADRLFCTLPDGCECPDAAPDFDSIFVPLESLLTVGMTGHELGEDITVFGYDLDTYCRENPAPAHDYCLDICPGSNGDPHLVTLDGRDYEFQAAGEYTLLRSADGTFEIQARQQAWRDSRSVSINSAVAVGLNDDRAVVYVEPTGTRLSVNGVDVPYSEASAAGELLLKAVPNGLSLEAPDGTVVFVIGMGTWGLNVAVAPSDGLRANGVGLLGPTGGEGLLPALPDGSEVPIDGDVPTAIYEVLGPAWEVSAETALFEYAQGEGPATFRDPGVPEPGAPLDFDSLGLDQQVSGMQSCSGVESLTLRQHCAFDVTVTGDLGFVSSYEDTEAVLGPQAGEPQPTDSGPPTPLPGADACGVLNADQIAELTGFEVLTTQPGTSHGAPFTGGCHWSLDAREPDTTWDIILNVQSPGGRSAFDGYVLVFPNLEHVPDIADDAVLDVANSVVAVRTDTRFDVQYINLHDPNAQDVLIELAKVVASGLVP